MYLSEDTLPNLMINEDTKRTTITISVGTTKVVLLALHLWHLFAVQADTSERESVNILKPGGRMTTILPSKLLWYDICYQFKYLQTSLSPHPDSNITFL